MIDNKIEYGIAVWLRQQVMDMISGVQDASDVMWDDTSPNWMTERGLDKLSGQLMQKLRFLGGMRIFEHAPCGHPEHERLAKASGISDGYWRLALEDGRTNAHEFVEGKLIVDSIQMDRDDFEIAGNVSTCPCRPKRPDDHAVAVYYAWPDRNGTRMRELFACLRIIDRAKELSGPRLRRSAVREQLLKVVIILNDAIVPVSIADHISSGH